MTNIFIANLDWEITSDDLNVTFSTFGKVHLAHVVYDPKTKKSRGFGYVEMESAEEAINAIEALNGMEINGRKLDVKIASPKSNRPEKKVEERKPFNKDGGAGFKKPFNRDGGGGGFKKPFNRDGGSSSGSYKKPYTPRDNGGGGYNSGSSSDQKPYYKKREE